MRYRDLLEAKEYLDPNQYGAWLHSDGTIDYVGPYGHEKWLYRKFHNHNYIAAFEKGWIRVILPSDSYAGILYLSGKAEHIITAFKYWWPTAIQNNEVVINNERFVMPRDKSSLLTKIKTNKLDESKKLVEGVNFFAGSQGNNRVWSPIIGDEDKYIWSDNWDAGADDEPELNPNYNPEYDIKLSQSTGIEVADRLGIYNGDPDTPIHIEIDKFINLATQWLKKNINNRTSEEPGNIEKVPGGPLMIGGNKPEGYYNGLILAMVKIARKGKEEGATHVWMV